MEIKNETTEDSGSFYINENQERVAELVYSMKDQNKMAIEHTQVDPSLRGKDVGRALVDAAVAYAREHKIKIIPQCSFARAILKKHTEYQDILA
jgi:predicted GNAT family acetyltransferase